MVPMPTIPDPPGSETRWKTKVRARVARWLAGGLGPTWVVAVSAGGDSVGLLRLLSEIAPGLGLRLSVAHLDHGDLGEAGPHIKTFIGDLAGTLGWPCDLGTWVPDRPGHFEADGRRARYDWLAGIARARGAAAVAVGHTLEDQAETVLHRIVRGTGLRGLAGIPARRTLDGPVSLVRPLLAVRREEVRGYLADLGQVWRDDPTNLDTTRTRSWIRHDLIPGLAAESNPRIVEALARLAGHAASAEARLRPARDAMVRRVLVGETADVLTLDRTALRGLRAGDRVEALRSLWSRKGWPEASMDARRWRRLAGFAAGGEAGALDVAAGVRASLTGDHFILSRQVEPLVAIEPAACLPLPGSVTWGGVRILADLDTVGSAEVVDLGHIRPPLTVRGPAPGDRFDPLGMGGRTRPLADFFRGRRVARADRPGVPLVCDATGIIWVVGHRIADRVRVGDATARRLGLSCSPIEGA
jgi:tRNA(Ile)-lysidine synthase